MAFRLRMSALFSVLLFAVSFGMHLGKDGNNGERVFLQSSTHHQIVRRVKRKVSGSIWEGARVPYTFHQTRNWGTYQSFVEGRVSQAVATIESETCLRFQRVNSDYKGSHLYFQNGNLCNSLIGRRGSGGQRITLHHAAKSSCADVGIIIHEILHSLGLVHEQVRTDRDNYVEVLMANIQESKRYEYEIMHTARNLVPYDLESIMHYSLTTYQTARNLKTMIVKTKALEFLPGQRKRMTFYDIKTLNQLYNCSGGCTKQCENGGYPFKDDRGRCLCKCPQYFHGGRCQLVANPNECGGKYRLRNIGDVINLSAESTTHADNRECVFFVEGPDVLRIHFSAMKISLNGLGGCDHHVEVRFNLIGQTGPKLCGMTPPADLSTLNDFRMRSALVIFREIPKMAYGGSFNVSVFASIKNDPCLSNPCFGTSTCIYINQERTFKCECPPFFTGPRCKDPVKNKKMVADFEKSFGFLENLDDDDADWRRQKGGTVTFGTGPVGGFQSDHYAYVEASYPLKKGDIIKLGSKYLPMNNGRCLEFHYHMYGSTMGDFDVIVECKNASKPSRTIFSRSGNQGNDWKREQINIPFSTTQCRMVFKYTRRGSKGDLALDNVTTYPGRCGLPIVIDVCKCDFESIGGPPCECLGQSMSGNVEWIHLIGGHTPSSGTGPDYASSRLEYVFLEASLPTLPGDKAVLETLVSLPDVEMCLQFSYHMYGNTMGRLQVDVHNTLMGSQLLWYKDGNKGRMWHTAKVAIPQNTTKIYITATKGDNYRSDIGVDDFQLRTGLCYRGGCDHSPCRHGDEHSCVDMNDGYNFICNCPYYLTGPLCDRVEFGLSNAITTEFELDKSNPFGIFQQSTLDDFDWSIKRILRPGTSRLSRLRSAHGQFCAVLEGSSPHSLGERAVLESELVPGGQEYCLSFHFLMYGSAVGSLSVMTQDTERQTDLLWRCDGQQSVNKREWRQESVTLSGVFDFKILIEGVLGSIYDVSEVALDKVTLSKGGCAYSNKR